MTSSPLETPKQKHRLRRRLFQLRLATVVMLGAIAATAALVAAWFAREETISDIFNRLEYLQNNPPWWLEAPMVTWQYLLVPTVILFLIALIVMKVSPQPRNWSRAVVVAILGALTIRYLTWRSLSTLNVSSALDGVFSLGLFGLELLALTSGTIQLFLMLRVQDRKPEADRYEIAVLEGRYNPSVDILIPTYDESDFILKRTVMGCQALDYDNKTIYLLDDTHRPEIRELANRLGCEYMTRPNNDHAKAGNLNHAIPRTHGEIIVIFDADFIPTRNFLKRTVGFFQDENVALVQTPQSFYNPDPIARNLGLENVVTPEEEVFYRQIQPIKDGAGSVVCAGTSFLVRRSALEATGCFVTESLSEDYFTGIRLAAKGFRLVYLDEKLSAGLAADSIADHAAQRLRWARGTLQAFFIESNPLTIPGLSPIQRLAHLEGLLHWFTSFSQVGFLMMPLAYSFLGVIPIRANLAEVLYFFLPFYLMQMTAFSWLNYRSRSALLSNIYSLVLSFPLAATAIQVMIAPFSKGFKVTPKGKARDRFSFNWRLALPLVVLFIPTAISLWRNLGMCLAKLNMDPTVAEYANHFKGLGLGWIWSVYNLIAISIALLVLLDVPKPDENEWFELRRVVRVQTKDISPTTYWGTTALISEAGIQVELTRSGLPSIPPAALIPVTIAILEENLELSGTITRSNSGHEFPTVCIMFERVSLEQHRQLVELLFCRPGQWQYRETPGEWHSLWILFKVLFRPRVLFDRDRLSATRVSQV
jgi:cellulose synthase (UDP-forming)